MYQVNVKLLCTKWTDNGTNHTNTWYTDTNCKAMICCKNSATNTKYQLKTIAKIINMEWYGSSTNQAPGSMKLKWQFSVVTLHNVAKYWKIITSYKLQWNNRNYKSVNCFSKDKLCDIWQLNDDY